MKTEIFSPKYAKLDKPELTKLWENYYSARAKGNGEVYRNELIENYLQIVEIITEKIHEKIPSYVELDDLMSEGTFGLIKAIEKFDPNKKVKFVTYANEKIRSSILDYLRQEDYVPRLMRSRSHQVEQAKSKLRKKLDYEPTREELIEELSKNTYLPSSTYYKNQKLKIKLKGRKKAELIMSDAESLLPIISLFHLSDNYEDMEEIEFIRNKKAPNPLYGLQRKDLRKFLEKGLTRKEKLILGLYYFNYYKGFDGNKLGVPMLEIGKIIDNLSESMVSLKHKTLMQKLKKRLTIRGLNLETCLNNL